MTAFNRANELDQAIAEKRLATPVAALEQRAVPRYSISELNAADFESVRDRLLKQRYDARTPIAKALDLIDLPRNLVVAGNMRAYAPTAYNRMAKSGETGAFGIPEIHGSDVLKSMGVNNRIVNGVAGLGIDLALDPLTYVGASGFTQSGKVLVTKGGRKALQTASKVAAKGGVEAIADPLARDVIKSAGYTSERLARLRAAEAAGKIRKGGTEALVSRAAFGAQEGSKVGRGVQTITRDFRYKGGVLDNAMLTATDGTPIRQAQRINAAKAFVEKYGRGTKSYKLGSGGSQIAHIPFTDYALEVPAFTSIGEASRAQLQAVRDNVLGVNVLKHAAPVGAAHDIVQTIRREAESQRAARDSFLDLRAALKTQEDAGDRIAAQSLKDLTAQHAEAMKRSSELVQQQAELLDAQIKQMNPAVWGEDAKRASTFLTLKQMRDEAWAAARQMSEQTQLEKEAVGLRNSVVGEVNNAVKVKSAPLDRLVAEATKPRQGVGFYLGRTPDLKPAITADVNAQNAVLQRITPLLDEIDTLEKTIKDSQSLNRPMNDLMLMGRGLPDAAPLDAATGRLAEARRELMAATEPLRTGPMVAIDDWKKGLEANETAARLKRLPEEIYLRADADPEGADALVNSLSRATAASGEYAKMLDGAIDTLNTATERQFQTLAQMALKSDDQMTGWSILSPFRAAVDAAAPDGNGMAQDVMQFAEGLDRQGRIMFGRKSGYLPRVMANLKRQGSAREIRASIARSVGTMDRELGSVAKKHGININGYEESRGIHALATIRALQILADKAGAKADLALQTVKNGKLVDSAAIEQLKNLQSKGALAGVKPEFYADLDGAVKNWLDELGQITDAEIKDELLGGMMESYLPNMMSNEATDALRATRRTPMTGPSKRMAQAATEGFTNRRSTWVAQWQDPNTGEWRQFYEGDRWVNTLSENEIDMIRIEDPERAAKIEELRGIINQYDTMIDAPPLKAMEPFQINQDFASEGRFATLTGGNTDVEDFFDTSLPVILAKRKAVHDAAVSRGTLREFLAQHYIGVPPEVLSKAPKGEDIPLPNGAVVRRIGEVKTPVPGEAANAVRMGGKTYRQLSPSTIKANGDFVSEMLGQDLAHGVYDEVLADAIDRIAAATAPGFGELDAILGMANKATSIFKTMSLFHPSWMVNNIMGDMTLAVQGGAKINKVMKYLPTVLKARLAWDNPDALSRLAATVNGQAHDGRSLVQMLTGHVAWNDNAAAETMFQAMSKKLMALPSHFYDAGIVSGLKPDFVHALKNWGIGEGRVKTATAAFAAGPGIVTDRLMRRVVGPWFRANAFVSDVMRGATMLAHMDDGADAATAAQKMVRSMFDYGDFTRVEEKYFRTLIPFYSWIRNNTAFQMGQLIEKPMQAALIPKVKEALEEMLDGEARIPENLRPRWMNDALAIQVSNDPENRFGVLLNGSLPAADVLNTLQGIAGGPEGVKEALHYFGNQTNPLIQTLISLASGQEFFSGRQIGFDGVSGDIQAVEYLARQFRPVSELGLGLVEGKIPKAFGRSFGEGVGRSLLGGRVQAMGNERMQSSRLADFKKKEEAYRRAIRRAENDGNHEASLRARVDLLDMYRHMQETGLAEETPVWSREQVGSLR